MPASVCTLCVEICDGPEETHCCLCQGKAPFDGCALCARRGEAEYAPRPADRTEPDTCALCEQPCDRMTGRKCCVCRGDAHPCGRCQDAAEAINEALFQIEILRAARIGEREITAA